MFERHFLVFFQPTTTEKHVILVIPCNNVLPNLERSSKTSLRWRSVVEVASKSNASSLCLKHAAEHRKQLRSGMNLSERKITFGSIMSMKGSKNRVGRYCIVFFK